MPLGQRAVARQDELADATLTTAGGTVVRVWEHDVDDNLDEVVGRVTVALAAHGRALEIG